MFYHINFPQFKEGHFTSAGKHFRLQAFLCSKVRRNISRRPRARGGRLQCVGAEEAGSCYDGGDPLPSGTFRVSSSRMRQGYGGAWALSSVVLCLKETRMIIPT